MHQFNTLHPKITYSKFRDWGSWNENVFVSLPHRCYKSNLVKISLVVLEMKMLIDEGQHPKAIGHLND